jgi:transcriptional regulator with XRE-family HTH domain
MSNPDIERLAAFVRDVRKRKGLNQQAIRERGGPATGTLGALEAGTLTEVPKKSTLAKLARGLGVPLAEVLAAAGYGEAEWQAAAPAALASQIPGLTTASKIARRGQAEFLPPLAHFIHYKRNGMTVVELARIAGVDPHLFSEIDAGFVPPASTLRKIAGALGVTWEELKAAAEPGSTKGKPGVELVVISGTTTRIPVFDVACGEPVFNPEHEVEHEDWYVELVPGIDAILRVRGESMIGCGYKPGDQLFVQYINGRKPQSGNKVIAEVDGGITCKIYRNDELGEYLEGAPGEGKSWKRPIKPGSGIRLVAIVKKRLTDE